MEQDKAATLFQWFSELLKIKRKEAQINLKTKNKSINLQFRICEFIIKSSYCEKRLSIKIDSKLHF